MRYAILSVLFIMTMSACTDSKEKTASATNWPTGVTAPTAIKKNKELTAHGDTRIDEYYWMNDYFKKGPDSTLVVDYLKAENAYLDTMMSGSRELRENLFKELKARIKEKDETPPVFQNGYYYYTRTEDGKQYYKYCRRKGSMNAPEEILLDVDQMAEGESYFSVTGQSVSPDNKWLAYGVDRVSRRQYVIQIKNLDTGEILADAITGTDGEAIWANDNKTIFYTSNNPVTLLSEKIKRHIVGAPASQDAVVYEEKDPTNYIGIAKTRSQQYLVISSRATLSAEHRILEANNPNGTFRVFQPRVKNVLYFLEHSGDEFLVRTNQDAVNFKLMSTPLDKTGIENWKEIIAHRPDVLLEDIDAFANYWVISERAKGLIQLRIRELGTGQEHYLDFGEPAYAAYVISNPEYRTDTLRYGYTSLTTPWSIFHYGLKDHKKQLIKEETVLGGFDKNNYVTERIYITARDSTKVPVSLVYKKGFKKDGSAPCLLTGYGSYGNSYDAGFYHVTLSMLDRGFVYAIAHIRGGQEMGRQWYENGKLQKKKNSFTDFIDCGEALISQGYTSKGHLYATGGSAGGLLMGAVLNMAPDLWNGIIADVPFVDVITTMSDPTIPLTTNEYDEWGNPENKDAYFYMKSYSPYDNLEKKAYPNLLVLTGLHDSQVQYFEPAKWVARMRTLKTDSNILLLKTDMSAGHGGASGRFDYLKDEALKMAFVFKLEGIEK